MRVLTVTALASTVLLTGVAGHADAAKRPKPKPIPPVCNLVTDPKGDTYITRDQDIIGVYGPQEDALDITSADIASDAKNITAVIRVVKLAKTIATGAGQGYELEFTSPGAAGPLYLAASILNGTETYSVGKRDATTNTSTSLGKDATGVFDLAKSEVRITAPISDFASEGQGAKPGARLSPTLVTASRNLVAVNVFADNASGTGTYIAGNPSCVKVGA